MVEEVRRGECKFLEGSHLYEITGGTCCTPTEFVRCIIYQNAEGKKKGEEKEKKKL